MVQITSTVLTASGDNDNRRLLKRGDDGTEVAYATEHSPGKYTATLLVPIPATNLTELKERISRLLE